MNHRTLTALLALFGTAFAHTASAVCELDLTQLSVSSEWKTAYKLFQARTHSPMRGFVDAWTYRRLSQGNQEQALFAEFWMSQALFRAGLPHLAHAGWGVALNRDYRILTKSQTVLLQAVASCLSEVKTKVPTLNLTTDHLPALVVLSQATKKNEQVAELILSILLDAWSTRSNHSLAANIESQSLIALRGSGGYESMALGLQAAKQSRHNEAIRHLKQVLFNSSLVPALKKHLPSIRMILARSYYATHQYGLATEQLKLLPKHSPQVNQVLTELAWAQLQGDQYREAIGTALNLQTGALAHTYAPEGPMILAMALNELCQFPSAVQAIQTYRARYRPTYFWLRQWETKSPKPSLYALATGYRKDTSAVPGRVAAEWIKLPGFVGRQMEINQLIDSNEALASMANLAAQEQRALGETLARKLTQLDKDVRLAKIKLAPDKNTLPDHVQKQTEATIQLAKVYRRYRFAAPLWQTLSQNFRRMESAKRTSLVQSIDRDLETVNRRMISQMSEIANNTQLIEIEIYNGASQDIIWKQAHPDYAQVAQDLRAEDAQTQAGAIWNWGRVHNELDEDGEYWEDELGTFKADLVDNCSSKDKYLQLKRRLASE